MNRVRLSSITDLDALPYDEVIDVRSPSEYLDDHIPGAVNLTVLDDEERARVGTTYVQQSKFLARRMGAALVSRNAARHLENYLADKPADYRPLVYCWRGGQRSGSFAMILGQIGWQVGIIEGGWKSWRRLVQRAVYETPFPAPVAILDGNTGTAKTEILARVRARGGQVIDLESLARHRGSLFGLAPGVVQPTQKAFESALAVEIARLDPSRPVLIEAESNRIGALRVPPSVWQAMQSAPRIEVQAPLSARAEWLTKAYADITQNPAELATRIDALAPYQPRAMIDEWHAMAASGAFADLAASLMAEHYDPRYARTKLRQNGNPEILETASLDDAALDTMADRLTYRLR
ncbi:MAG: tRNA 2-selenouridine(34) synthase MnmH [Paracoccaceae bacterium]